MGLRDSACAKHDVDVADCQVERYGPQIGPRPWGQRTGAFGYRPGRTRGLRRYQGETPWHGRRHPRMRSVGALAAMMIKELRAQRHGHVADDQDAFQATFQVEKTASGQASRSISSTATPWVTRGPRVGHGDRVRHRSTITNCLHRASLTSSRRVHHRRGILS
jgi:hypothetical protein